MELPELDLSPHMTALFLEEAKEIKKRRGAAFSGCELPSSQVPGFTLYFDRQGNLSKVKRELPNGGKLFFKPSTS